MRVRTIAIDRFGGAELLKEVDAPEPFLGPDTVIIRVVAAGVNPVDWKIREGGLAGAFPHFFPLIPGWDAAGVVEQAGPAVNDLEPGDEVFAYCRKDYVRDGTYAERVAVRASQAARKPANLDFEHAAGIPLAGLTAYQLVHEALALREGETVLVHAAAGGVGSFAVQIASALGARVIGSASAENHKYLAELGGQEAVDYHQDDFVEVVREFHPGGVDAVIDLVGGETQERSEGVLADEGRIASSIAPPSPERFAPRRISTHYVFVRPDGGQLRTLATMAEAGLLRVSLQEALPLLEAARAHRMSQDGHTRGKLVLGVGRG